MQIHSDHPPEQFEEMTGTGIWMHSSFCVCVFLLILADGMKSISSLAAGHHSGINRGECGREKYFFPCWSCVTLAVGQGGCCLSTTRVFFLPLQWCVCCRLSRLLSHLVPCEKSLMFTFISATSLYTKTHMKDVTDEFFQSWCGLDQNVTVARLAATSEVFFLLQRSITLQVVLLYWILRCDGVLASRLQPHRTRDDIQYNISSREYHLRMFLKWVWMHGIVTRLNLIICGLGVEPFPGEQELLLST